MILLKTLFYVLYTSSNKTNKTIPEWSTIITISILFTLNLISVLIYINAPIEKMGESGFKFMPLFFCAINWFYFVRNNRYLKIIENEKILKNKKASKIIVVVYVYLSIILFFTVLNIEIEYLLFVLTAITLITVFARFNGNKGGLR